MEVIGSSDVKEFDDISTDHRVLERATIQRGLCEINNQPAGQVKRSVVLLLFFSSSSECSC